jgi:hypothetical protein
VLLECEAVWSRTNLLPFLRDIIPPSSGKVNGGCRFLHNVGIFLPDYTASHSEGSFLTEMTCRN